eukprot:scaffold98326_cov63-Phaeocystis_antarctica.AAC.2
MYSITLAAWLRAVGLAVSSVSSCSNRSAMPGVLLTAHEANTGSADLQISGSWVRMAIRLQQLQLECVVLACAARDALEPLGQLASRRVAAEHRPRELVQVDQHLHALVARREEGADVQRHKGPEADRHDALVERLRRLGWWAGGAREQPWSWEPAERCARREAA